MSTMPPSSFDNSNLNVALSPLDGNGDILRMARHDQVDGRRADLQVFYPNL
jgi:hypothetical protein